MLSRRNAQLTVTIAGLILALAVVPAFTHTQSSSARTGISAGLSKDISPQFSFPSRYLDVLGSKMHYVEQGSGDPILLVHGNPTSVYIWRNIIPHLALVGRVIAVDLIGFGKSAKPDIEYRFVDHAKYLEGFIEKLGLRNITLVLHDWGGALGLHYAMRHESNVKGIALFEVLFLPLPKLDEWDEDLRKLFRSFRTPKVGWDLIVNQNYFIEKRLQDGILRKLSEKEMNHYREPFKSPQSRKPIWRWPNELPIDGQPADVARIQTEFVQKMLQSALPKLILYAKPGSLMPEPVAEWARKNLKNVTVVYIGEGMHNLQEDRPVEISAALNEWLLPF